VINAIDLRDKAFETVFGLDGFDVTRAAMFEDGERNLEVPHNMGLRTTHVAPNPKPAPCIDHHTDDLSHFLTHLACPCDPASASIGWIFGTSPPTSELWKT